MVLFASLGLRNHIRSRNQARSQDFEMGGGVQDFKIPREWRAR